MMHLMASLILVIAHEPSAKTAPIQKPSILEVDLKSDQIKLQAAATSIIQSLEAEILRMKIISKHEGSDRTESLSQNRRRN
jgi:hypothetical protein